MAVLSWRARWTLTAAAGSAALILATACGGADTSGQDAAAPASSGRPDAFAAYVGCLKQQGIDVPDNLPGGRPSARPRPDGSGRPSGFPSGRPSRFPSGRPSGQPSPGASGWPGGNRGPGGGFGGLRPSGVDDATWQKAQQACASTLPTGGPGRGQGARPGGGAAPGGAYANCLTDHGVTLAPDLNTTDPKVTAALDACKVLSPAPSPAAS
ncbi:hypothetical protein [Micromonospora sp. NBC_01796]|uniref:hypothetical protein n=1 Tax=Micromonospora sp. NBC_01796 TaxID=2975987 RepID=UPI002DDB3E57|nr:hypothetical protein [Micromonospora sp. NBC_01796]WSA82959.1 hypothetical protein OIE47_21240 [Micromonospora sp. NBC_01796]